MLVISAREYMAKFKWEISAVALSVTIKDANSVAICECEAG